MNWKKIEQPEDPQWQEYHLKINNEKVLKVFYTRIGFWAAVLQTPISRSRVNLEAKNRHAAQLEALKHFGLVT